MQAQGHVWTPLWARERTEEVLGILAEASVFDLAPPAGLAPEMVAVWPLLATEAEGGMET